MIELKQNNIYKKGLRLRFLNTRNRDDSNSESKKNTHLSDYVKEFYNNSKESKGRAKPVLDFLTKYYWTFSDIEAKNLTKEDVFNYFMKLPSRESRKFFREEISPVLNYVFLIHHARTGTFTDDDFPDMITVDYAQKTLNLKPTLIKKDAPSVKVEDYTPRFSQKEIEDRLERLENVIAQASKEIENLRYSTKTYGLKKSNGY